jgi:hypothetical protein
MPARPIALAAFAALALLQPVHAQIGADPIGKIAQTGRYRGGQDVLIGRDAGGGTVCFRREEGDSHRLDIGIGAVGAFVRLDTPEPRDALPGLPVRVYAGVEEVRNDRSTGRFTSLLAHDGEVTYIVPDRKLASFVLIAPGDAARFLAVVAAARRNFLVVEQRTGGVRDYVAVYDFDRAAAEALLACRQRHGS